MEEEQHDPAPDLVVIEKAVFYNLLHVIETTLAYNRALERLLRALSERDWSTVKRVTTEASAAQDAAEVAGVAFLRVRGVPFTNQ